MTQIVNSETEVRDRAGVVERDHIINGFCCLTNDFEFHSKKYEKSFKFFKPVNKICIINK